MNLGIYEVYLNFVFKRHVWEGLLVLALTWKKGPHLETESTHLDLELAGPGEELNKHRCACVLGLYTLALGS